MEIFRPKAPKLIPDGKGGFRDETNEEYRARRKKELEEYDEIQIERIMKSGFTRKQAEYLCNIEKGITNAAKTYVPPPRY